MEEGQKESAKVDKPVMAQPQAKPLPEVKAEAKPETEVEPNEEEKAEVKGEAAAAGGWGSWGGGWGALEKAVSSVSKVTEAAVEVASKKSTEVYGMVSKDLGEVTTHVGAAASSVKKTLEELDDKTDDMADKAVETVKTSVSSFWRYASGYATQMFTEEDLASEAMMVGRDRNPVLLDRLQAQLYALASDPDTFLKDPDAKDAEAEGWPDWPCDLNKRQGEISDLMMSNANVRKHYTDMVPDQVSHKVFWTRYFFKVHLIEVQEAKRQAIRKRAEQTRADSDGEINWDDVADLGEGSTASGDVAADADIPAELQDKLLSDYERELITEKMKKGGKSKASLGDEMAAMQIKKPDSPGSAVEKESIGSDDWEKLSAGEKSPKKASKEEDDWVRT